MINAKDFYDKALEVIESSVMLEREAIVEVASRMGECIRRNGVIQLFGVGHGRAFAMELGYRAGGLMPFHQFLVRDLALRNVISEREYLSTDFLDHVEYAQMLYDLYHIEKEDLFIIISESGCEGLVVEVARLVKSKGHGVVAVISKEASQKNDSRHVTGEKLIDLADLVIDTHSHYPDTLFSVDKYDINQMSTILGNVIAQMLTAETYRYLRNLGIECPVLMSANVKGADVHNRKLSDQYLGRWNS
ncbi:MAG: sugar isomerase domain-containing protein [Erysipelotrichales bacterium]|nr:sugar isomerase domain-containing protein [Erysipelotrichales bacterium]